MKWPTYKAGPVEFWLAAAGTEFINGFLSGLGGGAIAGASTGVAASSTGLWSGSDWITQILVPVFGMTMAGLGNAFKQFIVWHHSNPVPNPWTKPTGTTNPPFPPTNP